MKKVIFLVLLFFSSCKAVVYTAKEKENIRITDSIANSQIQDRIIDFRDNL